MPTSCAAIGCTYRHVKGSNIGIFRFPKDTDRRRLWILAVKRANWEPTSASRICGQHFQTGKPNDHTNHPDYVPTIFSFTSSYEKRRAYQLKKQKRCRKKNLRKKDDAAESLLLLSDEIPAVENIIVKQEIQIEDGADTSASETMKEISAIKIGRVKKEAEHENNEIITVAEQIRESLLNDELQQTKRELQLAHTQIISLVAEKNELIQTLDNAIVTQNALFAANSQLNDELKRMKSDLQLTYVDKDNIVAKKNELIPELDDTEGTNNSFLAAMSEKECEFSKVERELQQAYSEVNILRKEKEELAKKVSATDFPQSIFQSEKELHFYTGLDSIKDFQAVLSLLSSVQSATNCLSFDAKVLVVLIKLKWNFHNAYLAYRFNISMNSVQRICSAIIPILETKLELIVKSPINKALKRNIPHSFKNSVYENLYQRIQRFLKAKNEEDESIEPDLE